MRESLVAFAQNIAIPMVPSDGEEDADENLLKPVGFGLAAHHLLLMQKLQKHMQKRYGRLMVFMPPGSAKALALGTPIPTPSGWSTMDDLRVGDQVFDERGKPCTVIRKSEIFKDRPVYSVTTDCGDEIVADEDHLWRVNLCRAPRAKLKNNGLGRPSLANRDDPATRYKVIDTRALAKRRHKRPLIERAEALKLPPADLPIDPYILGVWLGDGNSSGMSITSSPEDQIFIRGEIERLGVETSDRSHPMHYGILGVRGLFVQFDLVHDPAHKTFGSKHIPEIYMRASYGQRLALLQGLIDTDGTVCRRRGCATFCNTRIGLALQVRELVRSLGVKAGWSESRAKLYGKDCGPVYKVSFYHEKAARLPRKATLCRNQSRTPNTYVEATLLPYRQDTVCIEVDSPSHLFLAGRSMTPTHNSSYCSVVAPTWYMGNNPESQLILCSYNTPLAKKHGGRARNIVQQDSYRGAFGTTIDGGSTAKELWSLTNGSEYMSSGLTSGITGNRAWGVILDDPIRGRADAESPTILAKTIGAYEDDLMTRLVPGAWIILMQTRWTYNDIPGRILGDNYDYGSGIYQGTDGMEWEVLNLPAKHEWPEIDDPLGRPANGPGLSSYLWNEWFDATHWKQYEHKPDEPSSPSARRWYSLFQQRPRPDVGNEWEKGLIHWFKEGEQPEYLVYFLSSDFAVTDPKDIDAKDFKPDFTEHGIAGLDEHGALWLVDGWYGQKATDVTIPAMFDLAMKWGARTGFSESGIIRRAIEAQVQYWMRKKKYRMHFEYLPYMGSKKAKFQAFKGLGHAGMVHVIDNPWGRRVEERLLDFPDRGKDDTADMCANFGRATEFMTWSKARCAKPKAKGLVFGSWEWLEYKTKDSNEIPW